MYRFLLPLAVAAAGLPCVAQTIDNADRHNRTAGQQASFAAIESGTQLTLSMALDWTRQANPILSAGRQELDAQAGAVLQAGLRPNPSIDLNALDRRRETRETVVQLSVPIELGDKRTQRIGVAEKSRELAAAELRAKWLEVRADVTKAFYEVLVAQERLTLSAEAVANAQRTTMSAARRVSAGKISPVDETKARVAEAAVRLQLLQAKSDLAMARNHLSSFWGRSAARFLSALGALDEMPVIPDFTSLNAQLPSSPAFARAQVEVERRQAVAALERSKRLPDLALTLGVKRSEELGRKQAIVGLSIPLPLFDRNQGNVLESLRRTDKARDEFSAISTNLSMELAQAYAQFESASAEVAMIRAEILPGADKAFEAASTGFEYGKFAYLELLDAQRTLLQTKAQYLRALGDVHRAAADIARLVGSAGSDNFQ